MLSGAGLVVLDCLGDFAPLLVFRAKKQGEDIVYPIGELDDHDARFRVLK